MLTVEDAAAHPGGPAASPGLHRIPGEGPLAGASVALPAAVGRRLADASSPAPARRGSESHSWNLFSLRRVAEPVRLLAGSAVEPGVRIRRRHDVRGIPATPAGGLAPLRLHAVRPACACLPGLPVAARASGSLPSGSQPASGARGQRGRRGIADRQAGDDEGEARAVRPLPRLPGRPQGLAAAPAKDSASYADSFVRHPFPVEEWCYYLDGRLVGVGYVDVMPRRGGGAVCRPFTSFTIRTSGTVRWGRTTCCA